MFEPNFISLLIIACASLFSIVLVTNLLIGLAQNSYEYDESRIYFFKLSVNETE